MNWKHHSRRLLWFAVVVLLVGSAAGPAYLLNHSLPADRAVPDPDRASAPHQPGGRGVVCFGYVDVEHGVASLAPLQPGRVAEVLVRETDHVPAGAPLLRLEDRAARLRVAEAEAALAAARTQLAQARQLPGQHQAQLAQQRESAEAARHRLTGARHVLARKQQLYKVNQITAEEVAAAEEQVKELEALERAAAQKLTELQAIDPAVELARAEAEAAGAQVRLAQARQALDECVLKAPSAGTVLRVLAAPGDVLGGQPGKAAVLFCPDGPRLIRAEVEQEFAGRLAVGQPALIEDDGGSAATWRGQVMRISDWYTQRRAVLQETSPLNDVRTVECLIALDSGQPPLRIGQRVRVMINRELP
ncbi:MAG TPA: HlyD family efflux transporter periplasmic adaptor subunit [Gemmataceae bacterium]|nr:HlyD family efflux transporter periplasmic adaptor subunit [Gemmataceae bacterium]